MARILGLDIGANSIGWALINDDEKEIIDASVRIFKEGVNIKGAKEESKNAARREARQARRMHRRRRMRLDKLANQLKRLEMFPDNQNELLDYFAQDPYELRLKGLDERLSLFEFGRILYHMCRRRGFKSNRKSDTKEVGKIYKGMDGVLGITQTEEKIKKGEFRTLGEYLASLDPHKERRRSRFTLRSMYEEEFESIWKKQKEYYPDQLNEEKKEELKETIFSQRKLKSQKSTVLKCPHEKNKKAAPVSSPWYQYFRILEQLNRIRISIPEKGRFNTPLFDGERNILINELSDKDKITFNRVKKLLNFPSGTHINLEYEEKSLLGNTTFYKLAGAFGKSRWGEFNENKKEIIWHTLHFSDDPQWLTNYAKNVWNLSDSEIKKINNIALDKGYARFSKKALIKLFPYLEKGISVTDAISEAGYKNIEDAELLPFLPEPPNVRNPIVQQGLYELRKVLNTIINKYGKPDMARIEMARELKKSKEVRENERRDQNKRRKENEEIRERLTKEYRLNNPSAIDVIKYKLWEECGKKSPYSGEKIPMHILFSPEIEIEHIIPYSRSLDDSQYNKTLCFRGENQEKGERTPYEAYSGNTELYEQILQRVSNSRLKRKYELFIKKELDQDFAHSQLNDTAYISKEAKKYLGSTISKVQAVKGGTTAILRRLWGLNTILSEGDSKARDDHRHHTIDALVIANTTPSFLHKLSRYHKFRKEPRSEKFPFPWDNFRNDVNEAIQNIFVSHRLNKKPTGKLHEESYYGPTNINDTYVKRINIKGITKSQINKIVDKIIKNQVLSRLQEEGVDLNDKKDPIPKKVFDEPLYMPDSKTQNELPRSKLRGIDENYSYDNEASFGELNPKRLNQFEYIIPQP